MIVECDVNVEPNEEIWKYLELQKQEILISI